MTSSPPFFCANGRASAIASSCVSTTWRALSSPSTLTTHCFPCGMTQTSFPLLVAIFSLFPLPFLLLLPLFLFPEYCLLRHSQDRPECIIHISPLASFPESPVVLGVDGVVKYIIALNSKYLGLLFFTLTRGTDSSPVYSGPRQSGLPGRAVLPGKRHSGFGIPPQHPAIR